MGLFLEGGVLTRTVCQLCSRTGILEFLGDFYPHVENIALQKLMTSGCGQNSQVWCVRLPSVKEGGEITVVFASIIAGFLKDILSLGTFHFR